ncbi:hypothetical protein ACN42_g11575 [Penicillium freii]|uniref:Tc1-like transposase DDE domain-containing protein n=1 Tax=Penicillium freii TaxID=48697 RepID=A0A124GPQ0_PENFR|nr:hypothetical protein ACN42_g11575 [Penicillium freii]
MYAQDGIVLSRIFRGSTDASVFESFIAQLLQHCGRWPEPKSVLLMDNASLPHSERFAQICSIKQNWSYYEADPDQGSDVFLAWCINEVGAKEESTRGHFRHAGLKIEEAS